MGLDLLFCHPTTAWAEAECAELTTPCPLAAEQYLSSLIWAVADLLRGDYKRSDFGKVIMPFQVYMPFMPARTRQPTRLMQLLLTRRI